MSEPVYYYDIEQHTDVWNQLRAGKFTASRFGRLFMKIDTIGYQSLISDVATEIITGEPLKNGYEDYWTRRGNELEPEAVQDFENRTFTKTRKVGFVQLDDLTGCSPDRLIGSDGLLQIKCPKNNTLIQYHKKGMNDKDYFYQLHGEMYVTGRQYNILYCYYPGLRPFIKRYNRDENVIQQIKLKLAEAKIYLDQEINLMR